MRGKGEGKGRGGERRAWSSETLGKWATDTFPKMSVSLDLVA